MLSWNFNCIDCLFLVSTAIRFYCSNSEQLVLRKKLLLELTNIFRQIMSVCLSPRNHMPGSCNNLKRKKLADSDMELDMVADMEVNKVADNKKIDVNLEIKFGERVGHGVG